MFRNHSLYDKISKPYAGIHEVGSQEIIDIEGCIT